MVRVAVVKYGVGNVYSIASALRRLGARVDVVEGLDSLGTYDAVILPGVGSYPAAARRLREWGVWRLLDYIGSGGPVLGICLGMQLLFESSSEAGGAQGLGVLPGRVERLRARKLPHIGWSRVYRLRDCELMSRVELPSYFYFMHSYGVRSLDAPYACAAASHDGDAFVAAVEAPPVYGTQFHPERSGRNGLLVLRAFIEAVRR